MKREFTREEIGALDLILAERGMTLNVETFKRVNEKYERIFASCSEKLVTKMGELLTGQ